ncbi:MAG: hypothetical protein ABSA26_17530 [Thermoguttaceae bacterium]|jgi:hypothetical protein
MFPSRASPEQFDRGYQRGAYNKVRLGIQTGPENMVHRGEVYNAIHGQTSPSQRRDLPHRISG